MTSAQFDYLNTRLDEITTLLIRGLVAKESQPKAIETFITAHNERRETLGLDKENTDI